MTEKLSSDRAAALLIFLPALLSLVIVLHHPVLHQADRQSAAALSAGISRIATANAVFHGIILLLLSAQALGLYSFAERLGFSRLSVRAGAMLYGAATIIMFIPGIFDGFVTPLLGTMCANDPASCSGGLSGPLVIEWAVIQAFTKVALALQALGLLCWSLTLMAEKGRRRWSGCVGTLIAIAPLVMLGAMTHSINPTRLAAIIMFEALWSMAAAIVLWVGALTADTDHGGRTRGNQLKAQSSS